MKNVSDITVSYNKKTKLHEININGMKFLSLEKNHYFIPESLLSGISIADFPRSTNLTPYSLVSNDGLIFSRSYFELMNQGNGTATVLIHSNIGSFDCMGPIGAKDYQEIKKVLILQHKQLYPEVFPLEYFDDIVHLHYKITFPADEVQNIIQKVNDFEAELAKNIYHAVPDTIQLTLRNLNIIQNSTDK